MTEGRAALIFAWKGPGEQDYERIGSVQDGEARRLLTSGKIVVTPPLPPTGATAVTIDASVPLYIPQPLWLETTYVIPDGKTFYLQFAGVGAAGDPSEKGARVEIFYEVGAVRHVLERYYVTGFTLTAAYDDVKEARDGTVMVGSGVDNKIVVRREQLSKAGEVDAVVRGYIQ